MFITKTYSKFALSSLVTLIIEEGILWRTLGAEQDSLIPFSELFYNGVKVYMNSNRTFNWGLRVSTNLDSFFKKAAHSIFSQSKEFWIFTYFEPIVKCFHDKWIPNDLLFFLKQPECLKKYVKIQILLFCEKCYAKFLSFLNLSWRIHIVMSSVHLDLEND